jgi:beta-glucosidase
MIFGGKTFALPDVYEKSATVLYCWYPGQAEGTAVAEVLFGKYNPGGKLPMTIARSVGHIPAFYNHKPQEEGHYVLESKAPLYCFGCGLSYTTFKYGNPSLEKDTIRKNEAGKVSVDVTNSGKTDGDEVVQMYVRQQYSSVTRPVKELKGFKRIHLRPGETRSVEFDITPEKLSFYNINMDYTVEPGAFDIMVGASSEDNKTALLTVTD